MSFLDTILINSICIIFPELVYLIYQARINQNNDEINNTAFEIVLFSSLFLIIKLTGAKYNEYSIVLINIPLLFSYIKGKKGFSLILSTILIGYFHVILNCSLMFLIMEYLSYYILFLFYTKRSDITVRKAILLFTLVHTFFFSFYIYYEHINSGFIPVYNKIFICMLTFFVCSNVYFSLLKRSEEIIDLNYTLKELEHEKMIRDSLFKLTHEIKNPIAVCKGYLDMIDLKDQKASSKYIKTIKNEISRTLVIMDDFLDITKIKINRDIMDINYLLEDTIISMRPIFKKNDVVINTTISSDEIYIDGDYDRLKQVLVNILKNALEAKSPKRKLRIKIKGKLDNDYFIITIEDNGVGMSKEELKEMGEAFYTTKTKGTGLGVLLSKEIVELHNGELTYESTKEKGTTVELKLPTLE